MYTNISDEFKSIHDNTGRTFNSKIVLSSGTEFPNSDCEILSLKLLKGNSSADDITFGDVSSAVIEAELSYHASVMTSLKDGMTTKMYIGLQLSASAEYVPMGELKVLSFKKNGEKITLSLADKLYDSDTEYISALTYPNTADNIAKEICNDLDISDIEAVGIDLSEMSISALPVNVTKRQMLSYIASYFGCNAYVGRNGQLIFGWYDFASPISITDDTIETPTIADIVEITALACSVDSETILTSGEGRALMFENPYMTQSRLDSLRRDISYYPCEMKQLVGSILLDFDVLRYGDSLIPIMSSELLFDGGVTFSIKSAGKTAEEAATKTVTPFDIVLEQAKKYTSDAIKNTTDIMNGVNGGYKIERYDADGNPYATLWMDAPDELTATHCIMINNSGIAFGSKKSGKTAWTFKYGWTIDGQFNTDYINGKRLVIEGEISDAQDGTAGDETVGLHYAISSKLTLPTFNDKTFDASGLKAWGEDEDGEINKTFFTNWGMFMDNSKEDATLTSLIAAIAAAGGKMNYFGNGGFFIQDSSGNYITGSPESGFNTDGKVNAGTVKSSDGVYIADELCLTGSTGVMAVIGSRITDCNSPTAREQQVSIDSFGGTTSNSPFEGSVGYIVSLCAKTTNYYYVQFGIRYRDNQIKMRTYDKANANSDGTNPAWSDWSANFVTEDVTNSLAEKDDELLTTIVTLVQGLQNQLDNGFVAEFDSSTGKGYEESLSGVIKNWGTATIGPSGTVVSFDWPHEDKNYAVCITPFGKACDVWYASATKASVKLYASVDSTTVSWMTVGL